MANFTQETINNGSFARQIDNAETLTLDVAAAETLSEGLILARNTTSGNLGFYARGGATGLDVPRYILTSDVEVTADDVTAGTKNVQAMTTGEVREDLISTKAGDTIDYREIDGLKDNSITVSSNTDLSFTDL
jgi:hypothetical protein